MEPHNNLLCLLQHFSKALCQPGGLRRERTLRVPHIADLKKRLASVDGQRFDVILLIGAVHKIQAQTANIRMEWSLSLYITCFITLWSMTPMLTVSR